MLRDFSDLEFAFSKEYLLADETFRSAFVAVYDQASFGIFDSLNDGRAFHGGLSVLMLGGVGGVAPMANGALWAVTEVHTSGITSFWHKNASSSSVKLKQ